MAAWTAQRIVLSRIGLQFRDAVGLLWRNGLIGKLVMEAEQLDVVYKQQTQIVGGVGRRAHATHHKALDLLYALLAIRYAQVCDARRRNGRILLDSTIVGIGNGHIHRGLTIALLHKPCGIHTQHKAVACTIRGVGFLSKLIKMIRTVVEQQECTIAFPNIGRIATERGSGNLHIANSGTVFLGLVIQAVLYMLVNLLESVGSGIIIHQRRIEFGLCESVLLEH